MLSRVKGSKFFACQFTAFSLRKGEAIIDVPSNSLQTFCRDQCVTAVMTLSGENNAFSWLREKFTDGSCDARACLVHQCFDFHAAREGSIFRVLHLRRI